MTGRIKTMLVVDDQTHVLRALREGVEARWSDWAVETFETGDAMIARLVAVDCSKPHLISIDLGLPPDPDGASEGLRFLKRARAEVSGVPLLIHSAWEVSVVTLKEIARTPASFIRTRDPGGFERLKDLIPFLADGYLICSPSATPLLPDVFREDPLDLVQWDLLAHIVDALPVQISNEKLAAVMNYKSETSISDMIRDIAKVLEQKGFIKQLESDAGGRNAYRPRLIDFYRRYREQFGR